MTKHSAAQPRSRGFTYSEVMVSLTIFGLAMAGIITVFLATQRSMYGLSQTVRLNASSRTLQERLLFDLRAIDQVTAFGTPVSRNAHTAYRSITATVFEYGTTGASHSMQFVMDPATKTLWRDATASGGIKRAILTNIDDGWFICYNRNGTAINPATTSDKVTAIRFVFTPTGRPPLVLGSDSPSSSALIQVRNRHP